MPSYQRKVKIESQTADSLYEKISSEIDRFLSKVPASLGKYELERNPEAKIITAKASLFSAELKCLDGVLELDVKLSLIAMPFRGKLDEGIDKWLDKNFPGQVKS